MGAFFRHVAGLVTTRSQALATTSVLACLVACAHGEDYASSRSRAGGSFGPGAPELPQDAAAADSASAEEPAIDPRRVRVRLIHGLINEPPLEVCYDPDLRVDDPLTRADETDEGRLGATLLPIESDFGSASAYVQLAPASAGALTFHRATGGALRDGGLPDGGLGSRDAGSAGDGASAAHEPCTAESRELVLPLPFPASLLDVSAPPDLAQLGVAGELEGGSTLTLLGSGLALEPAALERIAQRARERYLGSSSGDELGALDEARMARARALAAIGPLFVPMREPGPVPAERSALSFAHLVHDVPSSAGGPGALRLCVTANDIQQPALPEASRSGFAFRLSALATLELDGRASHTFRVFAADAFDADAKECAGTSLAPLAELDVPRSRFVRGRSYTLVALGALDPDAVCQPATAEPLARASCERASSELSARLVVLEND